jgi:hypothetical protein
MESKSYILFLICFGGIAVGIERCLFMVVYSNIGVYEQQLREANPVLATLLNVAICFTLLTLSALFAFGVTLRFAHRVLDTERLKSLEAKLIKQFPLMRGWM